MSQHPHHSKFLLKALSQNILRWGFVVSTMLFAATVFSQPPTLSWTLSIGGSGDYVITDALQTSAGRIEFVGSSAADPYAMHHPILGAISAEGDCLWTRTYDSLPSYSWQSVVENADQTLSIAGFTIDSAVSPVLCRSDEDTGDLDVCRVFAINDRRWWVSSVCQAPGGDHVICGESRAPSSVSGSSMFAAKLSVAGDTVWTALFQPSRSYQSLANRIIPVSSGGYALIGHTYDLDGPPWHSGFYVARLTETGQPLWVRSYEDSTGVEQEGEALCETGDGGFLLLGNSVHPGDVVLRKVSSAGNLEWERRVSVPLIRAPWAHDIIPATGGGWILAGGIVSRDETGNDFWLVKIDGHGDTLWTAEYPTGGDGSILRILPAADGGYYLTGAVVSLTSDLQSILVYRVARDVEAANRSRPPQSWSLLSNYPNPFNPLTTISFSLLKEEKVHLNIYDLTGRHIQTLADQRYESGDHSILFDGSALPSGIYFARLQAGDVSQTQKLVLLK